MGTRRIRATAKHRPEPDLELFVLALLELIKQQDQAAPPTPKQQSGNRESA